MIERSTLLTSVGVPHGFTTRRGGVSEGRFATLNMGGKWGDDPQAVAENRRRVAEAAGLDPRRFRGVRQVHGADVVRVIDVDARTQADGVWAHRDDGDHVVSVLTADCVPLLIAERGATVVCAVHSGWRGTVAGVVPAAVDTIVAFGIPAHELVVAIGPCIEQAAFEVGEEVAARFPDQVVDRSGAKPHVDLVTVIRQQLEGRGVRAENIERVGGCTHSDPERYFSYRRDGAGIGQMLSFVATAGVARNLGPAEDV